MPPYSYSGVTFSGQAVSGVTKAKDQEALSARLRDDGILLLDAIPIASSSHFRSRITRHRFSSNVTRYFRHLATLVGAGVPLSKALDGLASRTHRTSWREVVQEVADTVRGGSSLSEALARHESVFTGIAIPMVAAGEKGGNLSDILESIAEHREKAELLTRRVRGALIYPLVVSLVAIVVIWIMLVYVVPVFVQMFANLGAELPGSTRLLISLSGAVQSWWLGLFVVGVFAAFPIVMGKLNPSWRLRISRVALRLPILGDILGKIAIARVSRTISVLVENGVPLLKALQTAAETSNNVAIKQLFLDAGDAVRQGRPLSESLSSARGIPPLAGQILSTGEETANVGRMFGKLADFYEAETDAAVGVITSILEPALVVFMGIIVAGILIAMYLPMFEILGQIGN